MLWELAKRRHMNIFATSYHTRRGWGYCLEWSIWLQRCHQLISPITGCVTRLQNVLSQCYHEGRRQGRSRTVPLLLPQKQQQQQLSQQQRVLTTVTTTTTTTKTTAAATFISCCQSIFHQSIIHCLVHIKGIAATGPNNDDDESKRTGSSNLHRRRSPLEFWVVTIFTNGQKLFEVPPMLGV